MKSIIKNIFVAFSALVAFTACNDDNVSDLRLDGDCAVTALSADDCAAADRKASDNQK